MENRILEAIYNHPVQAALGAMTAAQAARFLADPENRAKLIQWARTMLREIAELRRRIQVETPAPDGAAQQGGDSLWKYVAGPGGIGAGLAQMLANHHEKIGAFLQKLMERTAGEKIAEAMMQHLIPSLSMLGIAVAAYSLWGTVQRHHACHELLRVFNAAAAPLRSDITSFAAGVRDFVDDLSKMRSFNSEVLSLMTEMLKDLQERAAAIVPRLRELEPFAAEAAKKASEATVAGSMKIAAGTTMLGVAVLCPPLGFAGRATMAVAGAVTTGCGAADLRYAKLYSSVVNDVDQMKCELMNTVDDVNKCTRQVDNIRRVVMVAAGAAAGA